MAADPTLAAGLADPVGRVYRAAETALLEMLAREVDRGIDTELTEASLLSVQRLRRDAARVIAGLDQAGLQAILDAIQTAANRGDATAITDLTRLFGGPASDYSTPAISREHGLQELAAATVDTVRPLHAAILRQVLDAYRGITADSAAGVLVGADTRRQAAQRALWRFAARGIGAFVDRAGRSWDLATYAEMATRTATGRATVDAHLGRLVDFGADLVIVSNAPQECELCRPWEGKVLSISGTTIGAISLPHTVLDDRRVTVRVAGTVDQARSAGLQHPNCRHSLSAYLPGVTKAPTRTADPQGDADRQQLRYLERQTREWKKRQAAAITPEAKAQAATKVRGYQARIRDHVENTTAKRQPQREQITRAR